MTGPIMHRRRILLDGVVTEVLLDGGDLVAGDGRGCPPSRRSICRR